jgi:hypothetical protein
MGKFYFYRVYVITIMAIAEAYLISGVLFVVFGALFILKPKQAASLIVRMKHPVTYTIYRAYKQDEKERIRILTPAMGFFGGLMMVVGVFMVLKGCAFF